MAILAEPSQQQECDWLGEVPAAAGDLGSAHTQNRPQHLMAMQGSTVMHQSRAGTLAPEEPDAFIAHVRVCGGAGWVTTGSTRKPTPNSFRSYVAPAIGRGSPLAFGLRTKSPDKMQHSMNGADTLFTPSSSFPHARRVCCRVYSGAVSFSIGSCCLSHGRLLT